MASISEAIGTLVASATLWRHRWRLLELLRWLLAGLLLRRVRVAVLRLHVSWSAVSPPCVWICRLEISRTLWGSAVALLRLRLLWVATATVRHLTVHVRRRRHEARLATVSHRRSAVSSATSETAATSATKATSAWTCVGGLVNANLSTVESAWADCQYGLDRGLLCHMDKCPRHSSGQGTYSTLFMAAMAF